MTDQQAVERFLFDRLSEVSGAEAYSGIFPEAIAYPAVLFRFDEGEDLSPQGERQFVSCEYLVFARALRWDFPFAIQQAIDEVLHGAEAVVGDWVLSCERLGPHTFADRIGQTPVRDAGGRYRILASVARP